MHTQSLNAQLLNAATYGDTETVLALIENGANPNATNERGNTPLYTAIRENKLDIALALIHAGANIHATNQYGDTPLYMAIRENKLDIALALIHAGANIHATNNLGYTPLHTAIRENKLDIALALIHAGANIHATNQYGDTPLHTAINLNKLDIALALIDKDANPNATDNNDNTPLHTAINLNKLDIALALIKNGANPNATNSFSETPLHIAIRHRYTDIVMLLIEVGAKINLHLAVEYCHTDVVIGLMQTGIDVHATDQLGNTALDIAIRLNKLATPLAIIHYGKVSVANLAPIKGNPTSEYIQRLYSQANNFRTPSGVRGFFAGMNASHLDDMMAKIKIHVMATGIKDGYLTIMNLLRDKSPSGKLAPSLLPHELLGIILQYAGLLPPNIDINLSKLPNFVKTPSTDLEKNSTLSSTSAKPDSTICHESLYPQRDELIQAGRMLMLPSP